MRKIVRRHDEREQSRSANTLDIHSSSLPPPLSRQQQGPPLSLSHVKEKKIVNKIKKENKRRELSAHKCTRTSIIIINQRHLPQECSQKRPFDSLSLSSIAAPGTRSLYLLLRLCLYSHTYLSIYLFDTFILLCKILSVRLFYNCIWELLLFCCRYIFDKFLLHTRHYGSDLIP